MKPKKVKIGTLKYHPRAIVKEAGWNDPDASDRQWQPAEYSPGWAEWINTGKTGLLQGFFNETDGDGILTVVGLVELPDGQYETFAAACLKLVKPTETHE